MSQGLQPPASGERGRLQALPSFRGLQPVALRADLPRHGLAPGEAGTIVHVFAVPRTYLVEFTNEDGSTRALVEVEAAQIEPA